MKGPSVLRCQKVAFPTGATQQVQLMIMNFNIKYHGSYLAINVSPNKVFPIHGSTVLHALETLMIRGIGFSCCKTY
jgi:hypothetical protein